MSGKWRAIQHRHRYTYSSVIFPPYFIDALDQTPSLPFFSELKQLSSLNSIYSQVEHAKKLASSFSSLLSELNADEDIVFLASKFYIEILFLENSLPLHKTSASVLAKAKYFRGLIKNCFRGLCVEYENGNNKAKGRRFSVSRAALTMMGTPKLGYMVEVVEECAVLVGLDVVSGLDAVVSGIREWSRPSPLVMEQCQEALSCMYYLLQRFPTRFVDMGEGRSGSGFDVLRMILRTMLNIFNSEAFSRDCFVAAGVSFCAALQVLLDADELGLFIVEGILNQTSVGSSKIEFQNLTSKIPYQGNLICDISSFTALTRLCLIRGILTAVSRTVLNTHFLVSRDSLDGNPGSGDHSLKRTILYDGILPELCRYCENPSDSHFNFHALTVMQICLQQIKTSIQSNTGNFAECDYPISEHIGSRILRIVWNNLEDPLSQTVKQVHLIFDIFLDIQASLYWVKAGEKNKLFLKDIAAQLLRLGPRCKGRYVPLASLTKRLGAKMILDMSPDLLIETTKAYIDDDLCCATTTFLKCFLECLRDEYWSSYGVQNGYDKYRNVCLPAFLCGLASGVTKLRSNMNTYALPVLLELDMDSIFPLLASIGVRLGEEDYELVYSELCYTRVSLELEQQVAILVSLLKVSRLLALIEGDIDWCNNIPKSLQDVVSNGDFYSFIRIKGIKVRIPVKWLVLALTHTDDSLRIDAAEFLFLNPKTSSLPSSLELSLMKEAVPLNMRCCSTAFQMKWTSLFRKFYSRVKTALERQYKQGTFRPIAVKATNEIIAESKAGGTLVNLAEDLFSLMKWLNCFLVFSCYPSAPYERKIMAMELMLIMLNVWSTLPPSYGNSDATSTETCLYPYSKGFTLPDSTLLFVGSIIDSWDRLRESSFRILLHFPTPLPGICSPTKVQEAITWAKKLVCSPRVRESDAGALTLRLIFRKYVLGVGWIVNLSPNVVSCHLPAKLPNGEPHIYAHRSPVVEYIRSLTDWLLVTVENGEKDLSEACHKSFVHGVLLALRYTFEELDWNSKAVMSEIAEMKLALEKLLSLVMRITSLALWVVSADAWFLPQDMEDVVDDEALPLEVTGKRVPSAPEVGNEEENPKIAQDIRTSEQIVMVGCWLAMKEVSLLLGTIIRKIPLPTSDVSESKILDVNGNNGLTTSEGMLDLKQLEIIGNHFLEVLLKMKHNGAIDKTRAGFTALCNRLLCSNDARLCKLTESWMEQLMDRTVAKGQTVDDLLRRSAGIPAAFTAFFLSEPEGSPKRLLPKALRWLIDVANRSLMGQNKENNSDSGSIGALLTNSSPGTGLPVITEMHENGNMSKLRDEGVIPTVHAFNVLRAAFNDTNLATDTSGFAAEALIISIRAFSSSYWEIRNSACLAYTALVRRMIGFLNVQKRESARRALTGLEFFNRYPSLHSFLFHELKVATELLLGESSRDLGSNLAKVVHPSLCPMLILLSRLKPSSITSEKGDALDPFAFLSFIRRCSVQSNFRIRDLASRAIAGLISNEKLPVILLNIASELPCASNTIMNSDSWISLNTQYGTSATFNSIHGILLQLGSLLDTNCRNLADASRKEKVLNDLIQILSKCSWIGSPQLCPCPILNSCFLVVLDNMLSIARMCQMGSSIGAIRNLVSSLSSECLDLQSFPRTSYYDPTRAELRKQAVNSYFNSIFQTSKELAEKPLISMSAPRPSSNLLDLGIDHSSFQERLISCISDLSYEVRLATLKWLYLFLKVSGSRIEGSNNSYDIRSLCLNNFDLQTTLIEHLAAEKNHKCTNYILKVLYSWNLLESEESNKLHLKHRSVVNMDCDSLCHFWDRLVSLYKVTRHVKTRQTLICCMGICMKQFSGLLLRLICSGIGKKNADESSGSDSCRSLTSFYAYISYFVHLIELYSDPSEPVNMRKAAAESVIASGLLDQARLIGPSVSNRRIPDENPCSDLKIEEVVDQYGRKILDLWLTCIKLLEDEDVGLRRRLAFDVQRCLTRGECGNELQARVVPSQVEKVIQLSIQHLSSVFGHWIDFFDYLCHWILSATDSATSVVPMGDLVRRVFDKEIDNHHEEKLFIFQHFCSNLEKIPISVYWSGEFTDRPSVMEFLHKWRRKFCQRLISFADDYVAQQDGVDWIGGVGNHKDAFLPLYANLLAFFTLSNCIFHAELENNKSMLSEVSELGKSIHPFLRNPLISNLYFMVVDVHEKMLGANTSHLTQHLERTDSAWDCYNAYFLLG